MKALARALAHDEELKHLLLLGVPAFIAAVASIAVPLAVLFSAH